MKRLFALAMACVLLCGCWLVPSVHAAEETAAPAAEAVPEPDPVGTLSFENLERRVRENNATVKMLQESIESITANDYDRMQEDLRKQLNKISQGQRYLLMAGQGDSYSYAAMGQAYSTLYDTFQDLKNGDIQEDAADAVRQLQNAQDQVAAGAESLYVALLEMENSRLSLQRQLAALDRTIAEMELRRELGQISTLQYNKAVNGRVALSSGLSTLEMNINNYTAQLELMIGAEQTGTMKLKEVPAVPDDALAAMDYETGLAAAKEKSYELYDAEATLRDARIEYSKASGQYAPGFYRHTSAEHTWQAAQYTYQNTVQNYELKFRNAFNAVADYRQIVTAKESDLAYQKENLQAEALKYQQGKISENAYKTAQDNVSAAETAVLTAKHDLFSAYRTYYWAVTYGVLN